MLELLTDSRTLQVVQLTSNLLFLVYLTRVIPYQIRLCMSHVNFEFVVGGQANEPQ